MIGWWCLSLYPSFCIALPLGVVGWWPLSLSLSLFISLRLLTVSEDRQASDEDIFVGAFSAKLFLNRQGKLMYKNDAHAEQFWQQLKHVAWGGRLGQGRLGQGKTVKVRVAGWRSLSVSFYR